MLQGKRNILTPCMLKTSSSKTDVSSTLKLFHLSVDENLWTSFPAGYCGVLKSPDDFVKKTSAK